MSREYFTGTATLIEGIGLAELAEETVRRHTAAFSNDPVLRNALDIGGEYAFRIRGESHAWTPDNIAALQHAVRGNSQERFTDFAKDVNDSSKQAFNNSRHVQTEDCRGHRAQTGFA